MICLTFLCKDKKNISYFQVKINLELSVFITIFVVGKIAQKKETL